MDIDKGNYQIINNTYYNIDTNDQVIKVLEICRQNHTRIIIDYGDIKTGISWDETHDIIGYVGRSNGDIKIPLLVYNNISRGGRPLLTQSIISIKESKGKKTLYRLF